MMVNWQKMRIFAENMLRFTMKMDIRKVTLIVAMTLAGIASQAQTVGANAQVKFGYLSYDAVLTSMADYAAMESSMAELRAQYEAELKRVEDEFNKKYEEFLEGQKDFPPTILQKRQNELQELLDRNIAFKKESQRLLAEARQKAEAPLRSRLAAALARVGSSQGLSFILNTDVNAVPWINITQGVDVTEAVKKGL